MLAFAGAAAAIHFDRLGLSPVALDLGFFQLRWYALSYLAAMLLGWWYMLRLIRQPGAPLDRQQVDDLVYYIFAGVILGGRLGYCLIYRPEIWAHPLDVLKLWEGGMSFHGGFVGVIAALWLFTRRQGLSMLRVCDYVACTTPFGLILVRIANFVNGELWGRPSSLPWAMVFPGTRDGIPRHPSQLYEAGLEGVLLFAILAYAFWRTKARYEPGRLVGIFLLGYGCFRFLVEYFREPDSQFAGTIFEHVIHMGQVLCLPMIAGGIYLIVTAKKRRQRVEPIAGTESVA